MEKKRQMKQNAYSPNRLISVIIPSYNSMSGNERLDRTLSSIVNQTYKNFEILVVDNFSSDSVKEMCRRFPVKFFELRSTISEARNLGLGKAKGNFYIFLDCDQVAPPNLFEECISLVEKEGADCVIIEIDCIPINPKTGRNLIDCANMHNIEVRSGIGTTGTKLPLFYSSGIVGNERFPRGVQLGEDYVFSSNVVSKKPKISKAKSRILHYEDSSLSGVVRRSWHYGGAFVNFQKESKKALTFLSNISIMNFNNLKTLLLNFSEPKNMFSFAFYLMVKYGAFAFGYLTERLT